MSKAREASITVRIAIPREHLLTNLASIEQSLRRRAVSDDLRAKRWKASPNTYSTQSVSRLEGQAAGLLSAADELALRIISVKLIYVSDTQHDEVYDLIHNIESAWHARDDSEWIEIVEKLHAIIQKQRGVVNAIQTPSDRR